MATAIWARRMEAMTPAEKAVIEAAVEWDDRCGVTYTMNDYTRTWEKLRRAVARLLRERRKG